MLRSVNITVAHIAGRGGGSNSSRGDADLLTESYLQRCASFARCQTQPFRSEDALFEWAARSQRRTAAVMVLLDSRGRTMTSEAFAAWLAARRDEGTQHIVFAVGPADGWTDAARQKAALQLSFGPMTLAHSLARLVLAEQIYRAFTILTGHPYHSGH